VASVLSSLRYLLADIIGDDDEPVPSLPENLPEAAVPVVTEAIARLVDYQGPSYAQLYVDRLKRFVGRAGIGEADFTDIARLMAARMAYEDPIRIAQSTLVEYQTALAPTPAQPGSDRKKFRIDELIGALPAVAAEPVLDVLEWVGWTHAPVSIRYSAASRFGVRRLKIEAGLKRWRLFSIRYAKERVWVERWLHMIDRALTRQPPAAPAIIATADMIQGYGSVYRHGLSDWHAIIDGLVKPTFDGVLPLADIAGAIAEARAAILPDARQVALKRKIAEIRARALPAQSTTRPGS
jgi:hypothetical protein